MINKELHLKVATYKLLRGSTKYFLVMQT